jgi:hypothetical protein
VGTNVTLNINCALGKQYQLQSIQPFDGVAGLIGPRKQSPSRVQAGAYFVWPGQHDDQILRIAIADVDSDGDGSLIGRNTNWAGPMEPSSNGQVDGNGNRWAITPSLWRNSRSRT